MKMEFSAGGIVYQVVDGYFQFALILDQNDQWTFPKGHIEKGEKTEEAAIRETTEEIGLDKIRISELLEKSDYWFKFNNELIHRKELVHKFVYFYLMENIGADKLKPQFSEIKTAEWFTPEKAFIEIGYKDQNQAILIKAYKLLKIPYEDFTKS
jgi:8-oxo-dGTP diphosphatase